MRILLLNFVLIFFAAICIADDSGITESDIALKNDAIISEVHARGGLIFAAPPYWGPVSTRIGFEKMVEYLEDVLDREVRLIILRDYEAMITRMSAGELDIGFFGASPYVVVKEVYPELRYVATVRWKKTGKLSYSSYLITRKGSGLLSLSALKGKSFAFGSKESTGGYKYPRAWMKENGLNPEKYFKSVVFLGRHDRVLDAIAKGTVDGGVVSPGPLDKAIIKYGNIYNRIQKFGPIPNSLLTVSHKVPVETVEKITNAVQALPSYVTEVKELDYSGFTILSDGAYDRLRQVLKLSEDDK